MNLTLAAVHLLSGHFGDYHHSSEEDTVQKPTLYEEQKTHQAFKELLRKPKSGWFCVHVCVCVCNMDATAAAYLQNDSPGILITSPQRSIKAAPELSHCTRDVNNVTQT